MPFSHAPVLLEEAIAALNIDPRGIYVDGTVGGAGHSTRIFSALGEDGLLIGLDRDAHAVSVSTRRLDKLARASTRANSTPAGFCLVQERYENLPAVLEELGITKINGLLLDLGVSSEQLDNPKRGFSYRFDAPLDMRMDTGQSLTAFNIVNGYAEKSLVKILYEYGEERFAKRIARAIIAARPIRTTFELVTAIESAVPKQPPKFGHPAMRTFQAVRIAVNGELVRLANIIEETAALLVSGGRLAIISFHSLEDRLVKQTFRNLADPCKCPRTIPYCVCGKESLLKIITKKPILPGEEERAANSRAHSAKLRAAERMPDAQKN